MFGEIFLIKKEKKIVNCQFQLVNCALGIFRAYTY